MAAATIVQHSSSSRNVLIQASIAKVISEQRPINVVSQPGIEPWSLRYNNTQTLSWRLTIDDGKTNIGWSFISC